MQAERVEPRGRRLPPWLVHASVPVLLWVFATVLFGLDLGRLGDDHGVSTRKPETGELLRVFPRAEHFFHKPFDSEEGLFRRPLYVPWIVASNTLLWNHPALLNLLDAVLYLGVAGALYLLLRALAIGRPAALVATAVCIAYPGYGQVVFWKAASGTTIAVGLTLLAFLAAIAYVRPPKPRWVLLPVLATLAFAVPAFNEQPAPALAAIPLFMLAAGRSDNKLRPVLLRTTTVTLLVGAVCALYGTMLIISGRDANEPFTLAELPAHSASMLVDLAEALALQEFAAAALDAGWATVRAAPTRSALLLGLLIAASVPWLRRLRAETDSPNENNVRAKWKLVLLAALAACVLTLPPVVIIRRYPVWESRLLFAPGVMLTIALGAGLEGLAAWWRSRPQTLRQRLFPVWGAGLVLGLVLLALMMVGSQEPYRRRAAADAAQAAMLRELMPDPPKHAFFMPLDAEDARAARIASETSHSTRWHGIGSYSAWHWPWTTRHFIGQVYERSDVRAGFATTALPRVQGVEDDGLRYSRIGPNPWPYKRHSKGGFLVPWDAIVPFVVLEDGSLHLVTALQLPGGGVVQMETLRSGVEAGLVPRRRMALPVWPE